MMPINFYTIKSLKIVLPVAIFLASASPAIAANLAVDFYASPNSGSSPLENVDLTANVSGTATGPITYKFDCTSDGSWEKTVTTNEASYTAQDLCDYNNAGNYLAKISVGRGGLFFEGTTAIMVNSGGDLSVTISAIPSSGSAPLQNVDLKVVVSGSTEGEITYRFDCEDNGSWEKTVTTSNSIYTATDLCSYPHEGNYTAKVKVERGNLSFQGTTSLAVYGNSGGNETAVLRVTKLGRNVSRGQTSWQETVDAKPGERLAFRIEVRNEGNAAAENVGVSDVLPSQLLYAGNLTLDDASKSEDVTAGIDIGNIAEGDSKILTFEVEVKSEENFPFGVTSLSNVALARIQGGSQTSDAMLIRVQKTGVLGAATEVSTGTEGYLLPAAIAFTLTLALYSFWYLGQEFQIPFFRKLGRKYALWKSFVIPRR